VYFSESLIIFTSNLGIYKVDDAGDRVQNVLPDDEYEKVQEKVLEEIDRYFKVVLNRPEILNRLGENLIVFDFIRPEIAKHIFRGMVKAILSKFGEQSINVKVSEKALEALEVECLRDLSNGGRGIKNQLEVHLVNPLARALFDSDIKEGSCIELTSVNLGNITTIELQECS
jgi:ATP-dependent Clp protease ATP-binding subunit ClpA